MANAKRFAQEIERIAAQPLVYRVGGMAQDGTCDCIGLVMAAMKSLCGRTYDMHCTNYFARYQTQDLAPVGKRAPFVGELLYKTRKVTAQLSARYLPGGRYDTGDWLDYYHVGVVTAISPLRIVECTLGGGVNGVRIGSALSEWDVGGRLKGLEEEQCEATEAYTAYVATENGALNLRKTPDGERIGSIPKGEMVTVQAHSDGWAYVTYGGQRGYASLAYLARIEEEKNEAKPYKDGVQFTSLIQDDGTVIVLRGRWRVAQD